MISRPCLTVRVGPPYHRINIIQNSPPVLYLAQSLLDNCARICIHIRPPCWSCSSAKWSHDSNVLPRPDLQQCNSTRQARRSSVNNPMKIMVHISQDTATPGKSLWLSDHPLQHPPPTHGESLGPMVRSKETSNKCCQHRNQSQIPAEIIPIYPVPINTRIATYPLQRLSPTNLLVVINHKGTNNRNPQNLIHVLGHHTHLTCRQVEGVML